MFRGDWAKRLKANLVVILAATIGVGLMFGGLAYGLFEQATYEQSAKRDASNYAIHAADKREAVCALATDAKKPQCLKKEQAEYELDANDSRRDYANLVAQRKSALWTFIMGVAALIGTGLSVIGFVLVYTTFSETRKANDIARESMERQLRAYLRIDIIDTVVAIGSKPSFKCRIENYGKTPALFMWNESAMSVKKLPAPDWSKGSSNMGHKTPNGVLHPSDKTMEFTIDIPNTLNQSYIQGITAGAWGIFVEVFVFYRTVFDSEHSPWRETKMRFTLSGADALKSGKPTLDEEGQSAT